MLGKLLGLGAQKSTLPKNQIEVVCPVCGAVQREPRLVVTTMCRKCGEHLRIEKRRVIASSQINPLSQEVSPTVPTNYYQASAEDHSPASLHRDPAPVEPVAPAPVPAQPTARAFFRRLPEEPSTEKVASALLPDKPLEEDIPPGLGSLIMGVSDQEQDSNTAENQHSIHEGDLPQASLEANKATPFSIADLVDTPADSEVQNHSDTSFVTKNHGSIPLDNSESNSPKESIESEPAADSANSELDEGQDHPEESTTGAASDESPRRGTFRKFQPIKRAEVNRPEASPFQKMREQGFRQQHFKEVECFDCHHKFKVGRSARNTQCPACSATICLEDIDINMTSTSPIRTRGDVYIRKMGNVNTSEIKCRDLNVQGIISANVECTGELTIRTAGTIVGEIHCVRLQVIKGSDIQLINTIYAKEVEIYARVCGNIHCDGPVLIGSGGCVEGEVSARSVNIEPGGHLDGGMNILRPAKKSAPEPAQQNLPLEDTPEA